MKRPVALGFLLLMAFDTLAQISFKLAGEHALPVEANLAWLLRVFGQVWIYGALLGYVGAFVCWMSLLRRAPIGPAFAASHLEVVSVMLLSHWLFGESLTLARLTGAAAILAGIVFLALAESRARPALAPVLANAEHPAHPALRARPLE
ncbi:MAG TPA: EamA family transporter [Dokdonella sp.]|jgi:drug/metabolite transporter (DMT)-like permease|nr:EamA family transporter [Dokdonella sp.]